MQNNVHSAPELSLVEVENLSRSAFLVRGALAVGAVYGATAVSPFVRAAFAQGSSSGDIDILNFALTLEYLEAAFYQEGAKTKGLSAEVSDLVTTFGDQEQEHVEGLTAAINDLGGKPVKAPAVDFGNAFSSQKAFLKLAQTFEDTGVSAYNGAGPSFKSKDLLATAGSIVQIEARHAAAIRLENGESPAPDAFDPTLTMDEVLAAVDPFVKS